MLSYFVMQKRRGNKDKKHFVFKFRLQVCYFLCNIQLCMLDCTLCACFTLQEMTEVMDMTPITGIATPRKDTESKFTFNPLKVRQNQSSSWCTVRRVLRAEYSIHLLQWNMCMQVHACTHTHTHTHTHISADWFILQFTMPTWHYL